MSASALARLADPEGQGAQGDSSSLGGATHRRAAGDLDSKAAEVSLSLVAASAGSGERGSVGLRDGALLSHGHMMHCTSDRYTSVPMSGTVISMSTPASEITAARHLVALYEERVALTKAMAEHPSPTGAMAQEVLDKGSELDHACEDFRRIYYPRRHRVLVGLSQVMTTSRNGRNAQLIFDGFTDPTAEQTS
jgi:hypothetical protein